MKRYLLLGFLILNTSIILSQKSSLNAGFDLLGLKDQTPYGAGFRLGYEFVIPKINFLTLEARMSAGKLMNDGFYQLEPIIKEWSCTASYFRAGICPRFYYPINDDLKLFIDTEVGVARMSGETYFSEQKSWKSTKTVDNNYYSIRIGVAVPLTEKLKLSVAFGYSSLDVTDMMNSRLSTINYRFENQAVEFDTAFTFHVIL